MNVFGVGLPEMAVIGAVALIVFGPKRLPELGRTLGKTLKGFQSASKEFEREINKAMAEPELTSNSGGQAGITEISDPLVVNDTSATSQPSSDHSPDQSHSSPLG